MTSIHTDKHADSNTKNTLAVGISKISILLATKMPTAICQKQGHHNIYRTVYKRGSIVQNIYILYYTLKYI